MVIFCAGAIENLGNLYGFGDIHLGWFAKAFSVTCMVLLMNAINMLDTPAPTLPNGDYATYLLIALPYWGWSLYLLFGNSKVEKHIG